MPVRWLPADSFHLTLKFLGEVRPDAVDSIVPMAYGNLALDLILKGIHGRLVVLRNGRYDNAPIDVVTSTKKLVDVRKHYNTDRLRPHFKSFEFQTLFIMSGT